METPIVEFRPNEHYCRYNGILMDKAGCLQVFGYPEPLDMFDDCTIKIDDKIYSKHHIADLIKIVAKKIEDDKFDLTETSYVLDQFAIDYFKDIRTILHFEQFVSDYPNISVDAYIGMNRAIQQYYDDKRKNIQ